MANIVWFKNIKKEDIGIAGGKGANLGEMYNLKLPIPPGFIVAAQAFKTFLEKTKLSEKIFSKLANLNVEDTAKLQRVSEEIQGMIVRAKMPESIEQDIKKAYDALNIDIDVFQASSKKVIEIVKAGRELPWVAVRSSATAEDLPSISEEEYVFVKLNNKPFFGKMEELVNIVKPEDEIFVPAMDNFEIKWNKVSNIYKHKVDNKRLFRITTATGKQITISPNHTLIVLDKDSLEPKVAELAELKGNEKIPVVKIMPTLEEIKSIDILDYISKGGAVEYDNKIMIKNNANNWKIQQGLPRRIEITKDFAYFLGLYAAEGSTYKDNGINITNSNERLINRVKDFIKIIGINAENKINKGSIRIYCKTLTRFLNENCGLPNDKIKGKGKICRTKQVPTFMFSCSKEIIGEYLKGCFDGDGTVTDSVYYTSSSEKLIAGISTLLELLGIELYVKRKPKKNSFDIYIPLKEVENFKNKIGFLGNKKAKRLELLIKKYKDVKKHLDFKNSIKISKELSGKIRSAIEEILPKQRVSTAYCPICINEVNKSSKYKGLERYYCKNCRKAFYEKQVIKKTTEKYVNYDEYGRFVKNSIPWNKSINTYPNYSVSKLKNIFQKSGTIQLANVFSKNIIWDNIVKIEEIDYNSWVYDFTVPGVENFASGLGGIITHNSASFAGQQETFLNIKGSANVVKAVQGCWASLYKARAIYYRVKNNFPHEKVLIAVVVQKMVNSTISGVMFTVNPSTNNEKEIMIESAFGLGEVVVGGQLTPDTYIIDKDSLKIKSKKISIQPYGIFRDVIKGGNVKQNISAQKGSQQKLIDEQIIKLAEYGKRIEEHYGNAQDAEWAIEDNKIFIVQTRAVTTLLKKREEAPRVEVPATLLLEGLAASPGVGIGKVKIIESLEDLPKLEKGDVLVTEMTNPDYVVSMRKASAIVTNAGGLTSHASIVSRELEIPCIVGTEKATKILKDDQLITVDGTHGKVYEGEVRPETYKEAIKEYAYEETKTKIYMNLGEPEKIDDYKDLYFDGIGLMRIEFIITSYIGEHPLHLIEDGRENEYMDKLSEGISKVAKAIYPKPVIVRFSDFKTNEYKDLVGGDKFEPHEDNPMLGWRGVSRYVSDEFKEAFKLECRAIKKIREDYDNVHVMLPFVRTTDEVEKCLEIMREEGLVRSEDFKIALMAEVPSIVFLADEFCKYTDIFSIGSNDLTQLILGVDRDSAKLGRMGYFDERNPAVLRAIKHLIKVAHENNTKVSICGQAPTEYPEIVEFLVKTGIDSISINPDSVNRVRNHVAQVEKELEMEKEAEFGF